MKLRKLFAGVAAAATLLGGLAFGTTANAADSVAVDGNGIVTTSATFKFTAEDANQWGPFTTDSTNPNNKLTARTITAYKIGDYKQNGTDANNYFYTFATASKDANTADAAKTALKTALTTAGVTAPDTATDPLAWAIENNKLDSSSAAPYTTVDGSAPAQESVTRKFADALSKATNLATAFTATDLSVANNNLTKVDDKNYTASLTAGMYLFIDTTGNGSVDDGTVQDKDDVTNTVGGNVAAKSAPILLASGTVDSTTKTIKDPLAANTVNFKNHVTPVSKTFNDKDGTVSEGQTVEYTLTTTIPAFTTGFTDTYSFSLTDTPGEGQEVDLTKLSVKVGTDVLTEGTGDGQYTLNYSAAVTNDEKNAKKFTASTNDTADADKKTFSIDLTNYVKKHSTGTDAKAVVATYEAKVTGVPVKGVENKVEVKDNGDSNHAEDSTNLTTGGFSFKKTDADGNALAGATFTIEAPTGAGPTQDNGAVAPTTATATSADDGTVTFSGLADGIYHVKETGFPQQGGFLHTAAEFDVTISKGVATSFVGTDVWGLAPKPAAGQTISKDYTVKNVKSITQLPLTGAAGIGLFTVVALLLAGAGVTVFAKSRSTKRALSA